MPFSIVVGAQWGDEGKGRIVDLLASEAEIVARYSGGDNAGHTVSVGELTFKLHLLPSGIVHSHTTGLLGNGMVINPGVLLEEMERVQQTGVKISPDRLKISHAAHLITPGHIALDAAQESARGSQKIGTTKRGIGPAYTSKVTRSGLRTALLHSPDKLEIAVIEHINQVNDQLTSLDSEGSLNAEKIATDYCSYADILAPYITDVGLFAYKALVDGKSILAEGAQGTLLDLDHGTYPFVTSSTPTAPGALVGLGLGIGTAGRVIGVVKAFQTRVGEGPFPTELSGDMAERLRGTGENDWDEFGTTTGRPRRIGWLDAVLLRYAVRVNGISELAVTKLDILSGLKSLAICSRYRIGEQEYLDLPQGPADLSQFQAEYEPMSVWDDDLTSIRSWDQLPVQAREYITRIEDLTGLPVKIVSVGPERSQVIIR
ncbi:MAG: adenylosuccinate synthase [Anaerolineales bacterium]|nr:adenylosuccinate synthase [Anaerolineales bacterium]